MYPIFVKNVLAAYISQWLHRCFILKIILKALYLLVCGKHLVYFEKHHAKLSVEIEKQNTIDLKEKLLNNIRCAHTLNYCTKFISLHVVHEYA